MIFIALCLTAASCGGNAAHAVNPLQVKPCTVQGQPARCGTLTVPVHTLAVAKSKTAALAQVARELGSAGLAGSGGGESVIVYPIRCAEPWARFQPGQISGTRSYYYQHWIGNARWWQYVCTLIPAPGAAARYGPQKPSGVPVLMINGTADPQDPPASMTGAEHIWPGGRLLIEPGQAHGTDLQAEEGS